MQGSVCPVKIQDGRKPCVIVRACVVSGEWSYLCGEGGLVIWGDKVVALGLSAVW